MRYSEFAACPCTNAAENMDPPSTYPDHVVLFLRFEPFVYRRLKLTISYGWPDYQISPDNASIRFPEPFDGDGYIGKLCRQWIIDCVRCVASKLQMRMCVEFKTGDYAYVDESGEDSWSPTGPRGGVWL